MSSRLERFEPLRPETSNLRLTLALLFAALMAGLLFLFTQIGVFGSNASISQSIFLCLFAVLLYTPLAYITDRWVYQRNQRRRQQQKT